MSSETLSTTKWAIDPAHTEVQFKVKHLVISTVTGTFKSFDGSVETENNDFSGADVNFSIETASIDTNSTDRDNHLRSGDFFDSEKFPTMNFSGKLEKKEGDFALNGELTIKDVTRPVSLNVEYGGTVNDPWGNAKAGFELDGKINRKEFGLVWNTITESGGLLVGEDVRLVINVELAKA